MASLIPAGIAAAGSVIGGITGGKGAKKEAKAIKESTASQINYLTGNRDYQYNLNAPAISGGNSADARIQALLNLGGDAAGASAGFDAFRDSTGYQFRRDQGLDAINQHGFAGGTGMSGATLKAGERYGQNIASDEFLRYLQELGGVSATGANARGVVANVGNTTANQFVQASQNGLNGQVQAIGAGNANTQNTLQNLINAGQFAYGSSFGKPSGF